MEAGRSQVGGVCSSGGAACQDPQISAGAGANVWSQARQGVQLLHLIRRHAVTRC